MSLTLTKKGNSPIATVKGGDHDGDRIYLNHSIPGTDKKAAKGKEYPSLRLENGQFQQVPDNTKERDVGVVVGSSGSGKSTYIRNYCIEYKKCYKNREIYVFSNLTEDKNLDSIQLNRVKIDESLIEDPLTMEDFRDSLIIFDDTDVIPDKALKAAVYSILDQALQTGRHFNISVIISQHLPNSKHLRVALTEMYWFCYFPWGATGSTIYVLENYCGVDKKNLAKIKATKSRWATVYKNFPQCVLTEKNIFLFVKTFFIITKPFRSYIGFFDPKLRKFFNLIFWMLFFKITCNNFYIRFINIKC